MPEFMIAIEQITYYAIQAEDEGKKPPVWTAICPLPERWSILTAVTLLIPSLGKRAIDPRGVPPEAGPPRHLAALKTPSCPGGVAHATPISSPPWRKQSPSSPSRFSAFIPITALSSSIM